MLGAIVGDIVGSVNAFRNITTVDFPLFHEHARFTDDTVLTVAIAEALMRGGTEGDYAASLSKYGRLYPRSGDGRGFNARPRPGDAKADNRRGNGPAMRVSPVAWWYDALSQVEAAAKISAAVTHNHPEGIKGAQATAAAVFLARKGNAKGDLRAYIEAKYGYDLSAPPGGMRPGHAFGERCQGAVPQAIIAFLMSDSFESAIRNATSLGGDRDALAAITGGIAEAAYGIPRSIADQALSHLDAPLSGVYRRFRARVGAWPAGDDAEAAGNAQPIAEERRIAIDLRFTQEQFSAIRRGLTPETMEDKWFIRFEDGSLYFNRSWGGNGVYRAPVVEDAQGCAIEEFFVEQSLYIGDQIDRETITFLIRAGLLNEDIALSITPGKADALMAWIEFGRMASREQ